MLKIIAYIIFTAFILTIIYNSIKLYIYVNREKNKHKRTEGRG